MLSSMLSAHMADAQSMAVRSALMVIVLDKLKQHSIGTLKERVSDEATSLRNAMMGVPEAGQSRSARALQQRAREENQRVRFNIIAELIREIASAEGATSSKLQTKAEIVVAQFRGFATMACRT